MHALVAFDCEHRANGIRARNVGRLRKRIVDPAMPETVLDVVTYTEHPPGLSGACTRLRDDDLADVGRHTDGPPVSIVVRTVPLHSRTVVHSLEECRLHAPRRIGFAHHETRHWYTYRLDAVLRGERKDGVE